MKPKKTSNNYQNYFSVLFPTKKKGLAIGQVFIFILAAVTFALIMIFGYKAISGFISSGEDVAFVQFKTSLETSIKKIYTEFGAIRVEEFNPPVKYKQICFVNMDYTEGMDKLKDLSPIAYDAWKTAQEDYENEKINNPDDPGSGYGHADQNVFLKPSAPAAIKVHQIHLEVDNEEKGFHCEPIRRGSFTIILGGKGSYTLISPQPPPAIT
tara:strand:+ start:654 stop:1286 length:633 start_codon:yes stop_codon:yes gene_type:complete